MTRGEGLVPVEMTSRHGGIALLTVALATLVLLLHQATYTTSILKVLGVATPALRSALQSLAVGGFLFLSGYKLSAAKMNVPAGAFVRNRLLRVYPLYALAVLISAVTSYPAANQSYPRAGNLALHLLGVQEIIPPLGEPRFETLWFVSTLLVCYGFFVSARHQLARPVSFGCVVLGWVALLAAAHELSPLLGRQVMSSTLPKYLLCFAGGMLCWGQDGRWRLDLRVASGVAAIGAAGLWRGGAGGREALALVWLQSASAVLFAVPAIWAATVYSRRLPSRIANAGFLAWGSRAAFAVFLFHRPIWALMADGYPPCGRDALQFGYITVVGTALIWCVAYAVQAGYDWILLGLRRRCGGRHVPPSSAVHRGVGGP